MATELMVHLVDEAHRELSVARIARRATEAEEVADGKGVRPQVPARLAARREPHRVGKARHEESGLGGPSVDHWTAQSPNG